MEAAETQRFSLGGNFLQRGTNESEAPGSVHTDTASAVSLECWDCNGLQRVKDKENTLKKQRDSRKSLIF